jgi:uncharacterized membrane protein YphA (DoxX/SURF4 family)
MTESSRGRVGRILLLIGRIVLAVILIVAAVAKMKPLAGMPWAVGSIKVSLSMFAVGVDSYQLLPPWAVSPFAHFLPPFELFVGLWLISGIALRVSSVVSTLLICMFIGALASAYERGVGINCGCFGQGVQINAKTELIHDSLLFLPLAFAVTFGAFWFHRTRRTVPEGGVVAPPSAR